MNIDENIIDPEENNPFVKEVLDNDKKQASKPCESNTDHKKSTNISEKSKNKKILEKKETKLMKKIKKQTRKRWLNQ